MEWSRWGVVAVLVVGATGCADDPPPEHYARNLRPRERYELTVTVENAPGPFREIWVSADYGAPNCAYSTSRFAGAFGSPTDYQTFKMVPVREHTWKGTIYGDQMRDRDYGMVGGVCRWEMQMVGASLRATGAPGDTSFSAHVMAQDIRAKKSVTTYFNKSSYPQSRLPDYSGTTDRSRFNPEVSDDDLFTVAMSVRKVRP